VFTISWAKPLVGRANRFAENHESMAAKARSRPTVGTGCWGALFAADDLGTASGHSGLSSVLSGLV
jgi:hypothetical protein